jgi:LAO/AO transport system kinase
MYATAVSTHNADDAPLWEIPVKETVATEGTGVEALLDAILAHKTHLQTTDGWLKQEKIRSRREVTMLLQARFMEQFQTAVPQNDRDQLITAIAKREIDPYTAVARIFDQISA